MFLSDLQYKPTTHGDALQFVFVSNVKTFSIKYMVSWLGKRNLLFLSFLFFLLLQFYDISITAIRYKLSPKNSVTMLDRFFTPSAKIICRPWCLPWLLYSLGGKESMPRLFLDFPGWGDIVINLDFMGASHFISSWLKCCHIINLDPPRWHAMHHEVN